MRPLRHKSFVWTRFSCPHSSALFINCYNCSAALADAKSLGDYERVRCLDNVKRIGLSYSDLIEAIEARGAVNISGCYLCTPKIIGAAFANKDTIENIWADTE